MHHFANSAPAGRCALRTYRRAGQIVPGSSRVISASSWPAAPRRVNCTSSCATSRPTGDSWHIYFGDERYLPAGDPDRNDSMAATAWLDHVAIPAAQIHRVPTGDNVTAAAASYASVLQQAPGFDLVLLGLGEDGHTASLFPGDIAARNSAELAIAVTNAPKPPPQRVSMSPQCLSMAAAVWFIVTGDSKRQALQAWLAGAQLPPQTIMPRAGIDIFTDIGKLARRYGQPASALAGPLMSCIAAARKSALVTDRLVLTSVCTSVSSDALPLLAARISLSSCAHDQCRSRGLFPLRSIGCRTLHTGAPLFQSYRKTRCSAAVRYRPSATATPDCSIPRAPRRSSQRPLSRAGHWLRVPVRAASGWCGYRLREGERGAGTVSPCRTAHRATFPPNH